jgi:Ca2+-binding RTX toxin-like protein
LIVVIAITLAGVSGVALAASKTGTNQADTLSGTVNSDKLSGGGGNDTIDGAQGNDFLFGDHGNSDTHTGEAGDDFINSADGVAGDQANAGSGNDTCVVDEGDTINSTAVPATATNIASCETVTVVGE